MRILQADLAAFITQTVENIRTGCENARTDGVIAELPDEVSFTVDLIQGVQTLSSVTTSAGTTGSTRTGTKPAIVDTSVRSGGGQSTTENSQETGTTTTHGTKTESSDSEQDSTETNTGTDVLGTTETTTHGRVQTTQEQANGSQTGSQQSTQSGGDTTTTTKAYA